MTDLAHPSPDDEIVSAVLDGEATAAERAQVAADPALSARLDELRRVRAAVAEPVEPLDEVSVRRLLDRALDSASSVPSTRLASLRPGRRGRRYGAAVGLGSAAVVALLAMLVLPGILGGGDDDADQSAALDADAGESWYAAEDQARAEPEAATDGLGPLAEGGDDAVADAVPSEAPLDDDGAAHDRGGLDGDGSGRVWLGRFDSPSELNEALLDGPTTSPLTDADPPLVPECPGGFDLDGIELGPSAPIFEALLGDRTVVAVVGSDPDGSPRVAALDLATCETTDLE